MYSTKTIFIAVDLAFSVGAAVISVGIVLVIPDVPVTFLILITGIIYAFEIVIPNAVLSITHKRSFRAHIVIIEVRTPVALQFIVAITAFNYVFF
jgi:hypothetical protein